MSFKAFIRRAFVRDVAYEELMGESLNHWSWGTEVEIHGIMTGGES